MSRELIVSVNGREKKIAIVENDRVTEFYIERGEQNQGIVGNIYKGRVMRVLPGMQSAFVDIGLERDAFLYVTDFFDEEAEFERIVVDKSKKVDTEAATRAATEHIEQARIDREHHIEATHERDEPLLEAGPAMIEEKVEEVEEAEPPPRATTREIAAAHVRDFVDEVLDESSRGFSFQRVSDEEESHVESKESSKPAASPTATKKESLGSRRRKKAGVISRLFKAKKEEEAIEAETETTGPETSEAEVFPDAEASVTSGRSHEEFATRRGGRRRRCSKQSPAGVVGNEGKGENDSGDDIETAGEPLEAQSPEMIDDPFEVEETQVAVEEPEETPQTSEIAKPAPRDGR